MIESICNKMLTLVNLDEEYADIYCTVRKLFKKKECVLGG